MSGTDELFPDATQYPSAAVPATSAPAPATTLVAPAAPVRRRGIGTAAFILGLLAILGDLVGIVIAVVALAGAVTNIGAELNNVDNSLGSILGLIVVEFIVYFGGVLFALLAVILGIVAAARNRGRVLGVFGIIFGLIVLVSHVGLAVAVATSGNVPGLTN